MVPGVPPGRCLSRWLWHCIVSSLLGFHLQNYADCCTRLYRENKTARILGATRTELGMLVSYLPLTTRGDMHSERALPQIQHSRLV
jgi:hypothetical protein